LTYHPPLAQLRTTDHTAPPSVQSSSRLQTRMRCSREPRKRPRVEWAARSDRTASPAQHSRPLPVSKCRPDFCAPSAHDSHQSALGRCCCAGTRACEARCKHPMLEPHARCFRRKTRRHPTLHEAWRPMLLKDGKSRHRAVHWLFMRSECGVGSGRCRGAPPAHRTCSPSVPCTPPHRPCPRSLSPCRRRHVTSAIATAATSTHTHSPTPPRPHTSTSRSHRDHIEITSRSHARLHSRRRRRRRLWLGGFAPARAKPEATAEREETTR